jgi:nucleoside-diphosphate-sugar epimerase
MKILLIGGTRFIGLYVVRLLLELGHEVTVFNRGHFQKRLPEAVHQIIGDRHMLAAFAGRFQALSPSMVIDMCAYNQTEAAVTMDIFRGIAARLVVISSMDVYRGWDRFFNRDASSDLQPVPFTEQSPLRQRFYPKREQVWTAARTWWKTAGLKIRAELIAREQKKPTRGVGLGWLVCDQLWSWSFMRKLAPSRTTVSA